VAEIVRVSRIEAFLLIVLAFVPAQLSAQSIRQSPQALAAAGWAAIEERRFEDALDAFVEAAGPTRNDSNISLGAGLAAFMLGMDGEARTWLERALKLAPKNTHAALLLGELHYRAGRVSEAVDVYEAAVEHAPGEPVFRNKLEQWRKDMAVRVGSYESRGAHFSVLFQGPADEMMARRAVEILEESYWRVGAAFGTYPSRAIPVVLYTEEQFRDVTRSPAWAAGTYDGTIRVPTRGAAAHPEELERVLTHEFVHSVVASIGGLAVPAWLNEGLASAFEPSRKADEDSTRDEHAPLLSQLERGFGRLSNEQARLAYTESRLAVERLVQLRGMPAVVSLLEDLRRGVPLPSAFHQRIGVRYEDFESMVARR
jgi:tetratricopeptide (TPR) repeat protein